MLPFQTSTQKLSRLLSMRLWTWSTITLSVAVCLLMTWLHYDQLQTIQRSRQLLMHFGDARIDLSKGFLHLMLSGQPQSPFQREEGVALLDQAVLTLDTAVTQVQPAISEKNDTELLATFMNHIGEFRDRLTAYRDGSPALRASLELPLYLSFHDLERMAQRVEHTSQQDLQSLMARQNLRFALTLGAAILLMGTLSVVVHQIGERQAAAVVALHSREKILNDMGRTAKVGGWDLNPTTGDVHWTDEVLRILDAGTTIKPSRENGLSFFQGESHSRIALALKTAMEHGTPYDLELELHSGRGERKWIRTICEPIVAEGKVIKLQGSIQDITERKRAEEEIHRQASLIKSLIDSIPDLIFFKDLNGVYRGCNPAFDEFIGRPREEIIDQTDHDLFAPTVADEFRSYDQKMLASLEAQRNEEWVTYPDGRRVLLDTLKVPYWGPDGKPLGVLGISRDITARKLAEEALRESEAQLHDFLNTAEVALIRCSPDLRYQAVNTAYTRLVGRSLDQIIGRTIAEVAGAAVLDQVGPLIKQVLRGERVEFELPLDYAGTGLHWVHTIYSPTRAANGTITGWVTSITDITERKKLEIREHHRTNTLELLASGRPLSEILSSIVTGVEADEPGALCSILLLDDTGKRLLLGAAPSLPAFYNQAVHGLVIGEGVGSCGATAYTRRRVIVEDIQTHPYWTTFREVAARAGLRSCWSEPILTSDERLFGTFAIYHAQPSRPSEEDLRRIKDAADLARVAMERQQAFEEILRLNTGLEQRVQERTAELQASNEELDAFVYAVSHDLRAPLRAMNGFSQALREDFAPQLPPKACEYLDHIQSGSREMGELIDGLLRLSRVNRGELDRHPVDISALAIQILEQLQREGPHRTVVSAVAPGLKVDGDARLLEIALTNLLGNAWKYTGGKSEATIRVTGQNSATGMEISVADNGAGFDMRHATRLFQPFQRLHRDDEFPGLGIGLATVQRIMRRHAGQISALATPGEGATFTLKFPPQSHHECCEPAI